MAASDPITDLATARSLIEKATAWTADPALTEADVDMLVTLATTQDDAGADQWTVADLNRVASLGWNWKAGTASQEIKVGVGSGKTFESQMVYDHCLQMAAAYGNGSLSVVGSENASTGTRRSGIGSIGLTSVMNT